ncbi:MAG: DUF11 domain-containing protein [Caldilineaceae bacterium]|nr:DUF11 domain-containing protein [Caldilineaceae bacterium]
MGSIFGLSNDQRQAFSGGVRAYQLRLIAILAACLFSGLVPAPALTAVLQHWLPAPLAAVATAQLVSWLPQPARAAAEELGTTPTQWVVLGNRLWLEDDFDGDAMTGGVKPIGAGYEVRAVASDGVTVYTGLTDAWGYYTLTVPANDTYVVSAEMPYGMADTPVRAVDGSNPTANDNLAHNRLGTTVVVTTTDNRSIDFGFYHLHKQVALGDRLWLEDDNDGDATTGVVTPVGAGHVVTALASDGTTLYQGLTDKDGYYIILVPEHDTYTVQTSLPAGTLATPVFTNSGSNVDGMNNKNHSQVGTTVVITTTDNLSIDFGFFTHTTQPTVALGNYVWLDSNGDGIQNEPPSAGQDGITVTLTYPNGATLTTVTSGGGYYTFTHLPPNQSYTVHFALPDGYTFTTQQQGTADQDSDPPLGGQVTVNLGTTDDFTIDAGLVPAVTVGDRVWYDRNHDGRQDNPVDEPGVAGVTVTLYHATTGQPVLVNGAPLTLVTDSQGNYLFTQLPPGAYYVIFSNWPTGYAPTLPNIGDDAGDSDADATGRTAATPFLPAGSADLTLDMGLWFAPASLGDWVWEDHNNNGRQDPDEPGLPGVTVTLQGPMGVITTTTDATGHYTFTTLSPGVVYTVTFTTPPSYRPTLPHVGPDGVGDSDGIVVVVPGLQPGEHNPTIDSGFVLVQPDLVLTKTISKPAEQIQPGSVLTYTLTYRNQGTGVAVGAVITESVSAYTTFMAQASTPGWSCSDGAGAGTYCTFALAPLSPGASGTVIFAVRIHAIVPAGTAIVNTAVIGGDGSQVEGNYSNNADEVTVLLMSPTDIPIDDEPARPVDAAPVTEAFRLYLPVVTH